MNRKTEECYIEENARIRHISLRIVTFWQKTSRNVLCKTWSHPQDEIHLLPSPSTAITIDNLAGIYYLWINQHFFNLYLKEDFHSLYFELKLSNWLSSSFSYLQQKTWWAENPLMEWKLYPQAIRIALNQQDPAHDWLQDSNQFNLHSPPAGTHNLCLTFSFYKPGGIFSVLEMVFEKLVYSLPGVGFTEINSFLVSPWLVSLPVDFVSQEWLSLVWDLWSQVFLHPWASVT